MCLYVYMCIHVVWLTCTASGLSRIHISHDLQPKKQIYNSLWLGAVVECWLDGCMSSQE
jgi:hypothetical protein